jgi:hypothetical protein
LLGQGSLSSGSGTTIAARAAEFAQRRVLDAIAAFEEADGSSKSMLRPLGMLRQAGHGGQVLQVRAQCCAGLAGRVQRQYCGLALAVCLRGPSHAFLWFCSRPDVQSVVKEWKTYSAEQQRELFDAALMTASKQAWDDLEDDLQLALDLAAA